MIADLEEIAEELHKPFRRTVQNLEEREKKFQRIYLSGAVVFALSMLAVKCDSAKTYSETIDRIRDVAEEVEDVRENSITIKEPCYTPENGYIRVDPC